MPQPPAHVPSPSWRFEDWIDFHILLDGILDSEDPDRFRRIGREYRRQASLSPGEEPCRPSLFRFWLERERREDAAGGMWPGALLSRARSLLGLLIPPTGLLAGASLAAALLRYDGATPINVFHFLAVLVGLQLLLLALSLAALLLRQGGWLGADSGLGAVWLRWGLGPCLRRAGQEARLRLEAFVAGLGRRGHRYTPFLACHLGRHVQLFGICFNLGALGMTLAAVAFRDLAFGWQTSLDLGPETVERAVGVLALAWSWTGLDLLPSPEAVEGTRFHLKESLRPLETAHLTAWWPFLAASLCFYGLLPRVGLFLLLWLGERRQLGRFRFDTPACGMLYARLAGDALPLPSGPRSGTSRAPASASREPAPPAPPGESAPPALLVAEPSLARLLDRPATESAISSGFGWKVGEWMEFPHDHQILEEFRLPSGFGGWAILLQEAYRPHTAERLRWIGALSEEIGSRGQLLILLLGRQAASGRFQPPDPVDRRIWGHALEGLGRDNLALAALGFPD